MSFFQLSCELALPPFHSSIGPRMTKCMESLLYCRRMHTLLCYLGSDHSLVRVKFHGVIKNITCVPFKRSYVSPSLYMSDIYTFPLQTASYCNSTCPLIIQPLSCLSPDEMSRWLATTNESVKMQRDRVVEEVYVAITTACSLAHCSKCPCPVSVMRQLSTGQMAATAQGTLPVCHLAEPSVNKPCHTVSRHMSESWAPSIHRRI